MVDSMNLIPSTNNHRDNRDKPSEKLSDTIANHRTYHNGAVINRKKNNKCKLCEEYFTINDGITNNGSYCSVECVKKMFLYKTQIILFLLLILLIFIPYSKLITIFMLLIFSSIMVINIKVYLYKRMK